MTAEVAVLSRLGVALAADSAVTISPETDDAANNKPKIYASAEKLFQLSRHAPVGIMFYGAGSLLGFPWETVVKVYRADRGDKSFPTVADYARDFFSFVAESRTLLSDTIQRGFVENSAHVLSGWLADEFKAAIQAKIDASDEKKISDTEARTVLAEMLTRRREDMDKRDKWLDLPDGFATELRSRYGAQIESAARQLVGADAEAGTLESAVGLLCAMLSCWGLNPYHDAGVVVAGFGADETLPSLVRTEIVGVAADTVLVKTRRTFPVERPTGAWIIPFADANPVYTFIQGVDPDLRQQVVDSMGVLVKGMSAKVVEFLASRSADLAKEAEDKLRPMLEALGAEAATKWEELVTTQFQAPIMDMVQHLPKDEMANMAESLVNLAKFRNRVSPRPETVGGPIDVAVITKGDGFVWVRRKHYFPAELNLRVLARYLRGAI